MRYQIEGSNLVLYPSDDDLQTLRELKEADPHAFGCMPQLCELLEPLLTNSDLCWIDSRDTGDLTDAPMLGILGDEGIEGRDIFPDHLGLVMVGSDGKHTIVQPILSRWAFMDYQVRTVLEDLLDTGKAVFIS